MNKPSHAGLPAHIPTSLSPLYLSSPFCALMVGETDVSEMFVSMKIKPQPWSHPSWGIQGLMSQFLTSVIIWCQLMKTEKWGWLWCHIFVCPTLRTKHTDGTVLGPYGNRQWIGGNSIWSICSIYHCCQFDDYWYFCSFCALGVCKLVCIWETQLFWCQFTLEKISVCFQNL